MAIAWAMVNAASTVTILPFLSTRSAGLRPALAGAAIRFACAFAGEERPFDNMLTVLAVPTAPIACRNWRRGTVSATATALRQEKSAIDRGGLSYFLPK